MRRVKLEPVISNFALGENEFVYKIIVLNSSRLVAATSAGLSFIDAKRMNVVAQVKPFESYDSVGDIKLFGDYLVILDWLHSRLVRIRWKDYTYNTLTFEGAAESYLQKVEKGGFMFVTRSAKAGTESQERWVRESANSFEKGYVYLLNSKGLNKIAEIRKHFNYGLINKRGIIALYQSASNIEDPETSLLFFDPWKAKFLSETRLDLTAGLGWADMKQVPDVNVLEDGTFVAIDEKNKLYHFSKDGVLLKQIIVPIEENAPEAQAIFVHAYALANGGYYLEGMSRWKGGHHFYTSTHVAFLDHEWNLLAKSELECPPRSNYAGQVLGDSILSTVNVGNTSCKNGQAYESEKRIMTEVMRIKLVK